MSHFALGLMSGTSMDGVDAALVRFTDDGQVELAAFRTIPYERTFQDRLLRSLSAGSARELALLHAELGDRHADAAAALLRSEGIDAPEVRFVAMHGQTIWHEPGAATLQLGDPARVAERLGIPVVSDFRSRDVAAGGQGAPLVPRADTVLFGAPDGGRTLVNIGGVANVTWVPKQGAFDGVIAFDTGPGVGVLDGVVRRVSPETPFDEDGRLARSGTANHALVDEFLADPFFERPPPKSTGREHFGESTVERLLAAVPNPSDAAATAVRLTVASIGGQIRRWLPADARRDILVSGGGARHPLVLSELRAAFDDGVVRLFEEVFFDGDAREAVAFAYLGELTMNGECGNVPAATGASGPRVLGRITPA